MFKVNSTLNIFQYNLLFGKKTVLRALNETNSLNFKNVIRIFIANLFAVQGGQF